MAEHITDKQIEQLFKLADEIIRAPSRFTKDFVVENLGLGVADLCGVIDRLRAQLAEIGETREAIAAAIEKLPEPEAPGGYAVPAWYGGYEDGLDAAIRIVRGEQREVPDA